MLGLGLGIDESNVRASYDLNGSPLASVWLLLGSNKSKIQTMNHLCVGEWGGHRGLGLGLVVTTVTLKWVNDGKFSGL